MFIARSTPAYVVAYLVLMVPTYILPYFGSNSTLVNAFSAALGMGPTPQWWAHLWCLTMLAVLGWLRGNAIGKAFLPVFPVLAAVFDLTPGLSAIPLIPTLLHLAGIIVGVMVAPNVTMEAAPGNGEFILMRKAKIIAGLATLFAIGGSTLFVATMSQAGKSLQGLSKPSEAKAPATEASTVQPVIRKDAVPVAAPLSASSEADIQPQSLPKVAHATPVTPLHKATSRAVSGQGDSQKAAAKPVNQEKPNIRYIRLND